LLHQKPRHGYDIRSAFEAMVGGPAVWDLKPAQVYTTLQRLERDGLVEPAETEQISGPERVVFRLTDPGRRALDDWLSSGVHSDHVRDHFWVKLMVATRTDEVDPRDVVRLQRATLYRELHALTTSRAELDRSSELSRVTLLDKAVMHMEADLRWLDMVEGRLAEIEKQPFATPLAPRRGRPPKADIAQAG
jgi:DNA-binding PadR family transcriptional regulator